MWVEWLFVSESYKWEVANKMRNLFEGFSNSKISSPKDIRVNTHIWNVNITKMDTNYIVVSFGLCFFCVLLRIVPLYLCRVVSLFLFRIGFSVSWRLFRDILANTTNLELKCNTFFSPWQTALVWQCLKAFNFVTLSACQPLFDRV